VELAAQPSFQRLEIPAATSCRSVLHQFFCEDARLAIELDGFGHSLPDQRAHDEEREKFLTRLGIKVLRYPNARLRREAQVIRDAVYQSLRERAPL